MELYLNFCSKKAKATSVKTAANSLAEEKMLTRQVNRLQESHPLPGHPEFTHFQNWLLMDHIPAFKDQERLIRHRYLDMINRELEYRERRAEEQRRLWMDREERRHWDHMRRKLGLRRQMEEEWKAKEMLLLTRIVEDVKREARIEEQRRRNREESERRKQALLERKMAYHLQKMQQNGLRREDIGKNMSDYRGQESTHPESYTPTKKKKPSDDIKAIYAVGDQKANKGGYVLEQTLGVHQSPNISKNVVINSSTPAVFLSNARDNGTEQKKDGVTKKSSISNGKGAANTLPPDVLLSAQNSPTRNFHRSSQTYLEPTKTEDYNTSFAPNASMMNEKDTTAVWTKRQYKRSSNGYDARPPAPDAAQNSFPPQVLTNIQLNQLHKKVTSDELNSILQNIMAWVVATVTSILYPAITRYEERLRSQAYPRAAESVLSSESSSFCSTCSEGFTCGSYTTATTRPFPRAPRAFAMDIELRRPPTPLKPLSAHVERTVVEKTYHTEGPPSAHVERTVVEKTYHAEGLPSAHVERTVVEKTYSADGPPVTTSLTYNTATGVYAHPKLRSCKSDSYLLASFEGGAQKSKDATTETEMDGLEGPLLLKQKAKAEIKNLEKIFVNFKCHLKGETELILESIFQEIMSDLTQAIPSISSVTAEVFVDPSEPDLGDFLSNVDISCVASEIVENMLEKLQSAVEKRCVEMFAQEDWPVDMAPSLPSIGECLLPSSGRLPAAPQARPGEPMCDVAEDMVQTILAKLMALAVGKKDELPSLASAAKPLQPQRTPGPAGASLRRAHAKEAGPEPEVANFLVKEEIQSLISSIFARSSLVGYIEEAISTILGYVQTELNNERLVASEETVVFLRLLDDIFTQLHQEPVKAEAPRGRRPRPRPPPDAEEKYRLAGTALASGARPRKPLPPINVPGMVLYSDDSSEEIDRIVEKVLDSSLKSETAKSQEWGSECWFPERNTHLDRNSKPPPRPASLRSKVVFYEGSKTEAPGAHKNEVLKGKAGSTKDALTFSQDQKHQIQKASANVIHGVLKEMLHDLSPPRGPAGGRAGRAAAVFSGGLSVPEQLDQLFSVPEVNAVAQDITEAVINILHATLSRMPGTPQSPIPSSGRRPPLGRSHPPDVAREAPHKTPLKIWFDSEKKMKYLSSLDLGPEVPSPLGSETREAKPVDDISGDIVDMVFKKLKGLVYPKLHVSATPPCAAPSSLRRQLSTYAAKVVGIVLQAIQNELELGQESQSPPGADGGGQPLRGKERSADTDDADSLVSDLSKDIMASPLLTCICEMLSSTLSDRSSPSLPPDEPRRPSVSCGPDGIGKPPALPSRQEGQSFYRSLATPCAIHSEPKGKDRRDKGKPQVLDSIGETLCELLYKLLGAHPEGPPPREKTSENRGTALELPPNLQLLSQTILDSILAKLCRADEDTAGCAASGVTAAASECLEIDNLSFKSIIEEMAKCTNIISSILSRMLRESSREEAGKDAKTVAPPGPCKTGSTRETQPNRLTAMAADILNVVFAKLEGFASGSLGALGPVSEGRKASAKVELPGDGTSEAVDACEELLRSVLYMHARRASSTILKAIQTELGGSPGDLRASAKSPSPERQLLKNVINLILDAVSSDVFDDAGSQGRAMESCGYRPTYGNFLPGGAEPDPCLEDAAPAEKEFGAEGTLPREETPPGSLKQWVLERTLNKIAGKLKEPQKSPIVPIIRNILNEIFQGVLVNQSNVLSLSCPPLRGAPHDVDGEPLAPTSSVPFIDQRTGPLVSEADVTAVVGDVVTTVLHKLYAAAMTQRNASENRFKTITFSANVSFHVPACAEPSSVAVLDGNPCPVPPRLKAKGNVAEDIIQEILTNLETFTTYKVKSLFCPQIKFTVPVAFPVQHDQSILSKALSAQGLYPDEGFPSCSTDRVLKKTNSCQLSLHKLNSHATEVARRILQGIKHGLDQERESPFLTHNMVVSEGIASQIVDTVLAIVSSRGQFGKHDPEDELRPGLQGGVVKRMFHGTAYRKELQFQIQDVMEGILRDIYEKTLHQNNLALATPVPGGLRADRPPAADRELPSEGANQIAPPLSVPKSDVLLMSNDIVDLVLHNLGSAVTLGMRPEHAPPPARPPLPFGDRFPQVEYHLPPLMGSRSDANAECFPSSENGRSAYAVARQITMVEREDPARPAPDPCEENAHFITTTIASQLESFATRRIDALITLALQPKEKPFASPGLEPGEPDDGLLRDPSHRASAVNVHKLPTGTILGQELANPTLASYGQTRGPTLHLSQASLKEYADVIASVVLKLIKNDLDLEIQRACLHPNKISLQENVAMSEIVNNTLKILNAKRSVRELPFYAKEPPGPFTPLAVPPATLLGQSELDRNTPLPPFAQRPSEPSQRRVGKGSQRAILEEIFMRRGESNPKENTALLTPVREVLKKVYQQVVKIQGHLPPSNETSYAASNCKTKTADITHRHGVQSHINSTANDIVESVLGEMYAVVVASLHESRPKEAFEDNGTCPKPPSCAGEAKPAGRGRNPTAYLMPPAYPSPGAPNTPLLESSSQQPSPLQVGKELVQMVLDKITCFASAYLEETPERYAEELQPQRLQSLKVNGKGSLQPSFKTSLKAKSKVTSLPNLKTKPPLGPAGARAKGKTKAGPGERPPKGSQSKTSLGLPPPHTLTPGDTKGARGARLPAADLRAHAARVTSAILETTVNEFEKAKQTRAVVSVKALPWDQIVAANRLVCAVLQGVYAPGTHSRAPPSTFAAPAPADLKPSLGHRGVGGFAEKQACFYLENVSSQLEQIFPKDGMFRKTFDKWQAEANDMESEKCNLLVVAEDVLTVISMKSKELEYSLSLLNLTPPEDWESRLHNRFKGTPARAEVTKAQINMFAREMVEMLLEKLQLCFLSQMPAPDSKDALAAGRKEHTAQSKHGFPAKDVLSSVPVYCVDTQDPVSLGSAQQIVLDIVERVLSMLESFVDLQFKHTCRYEFSEMVKMPVESLLPGQQRPFSRKMLPQLHSLKKPADDSRSNSIISKEDAQNVFLQVHAFHSELLTCAVTITSGMLGVIKSKLDKEISQAEPRGSRLHENVAASDIIGALMDQCTHVSKSLIKSLPSSFPGVENTYIVNHFALAPDMKTPKSKGVRFGNGPPPVSVPGLVLYPEGDMKERYRAPPNVPSYARASGEGPVRSSEPMARPDSAYAPTPSRNKVPGHGPGEWSFDGAMPGTGSLPEGTILQKLSKRVTESTEEALKQGLSFIETQKAKNPKVFHYGAPKPVGGPRQTQTTVSPLKICLAAENIVNTVLSSYGFPSQPPTDERTETMRPFFISAPSPGGHGGEKRSVLAMWGDRTGCIPRGGSRNPEASTGDFSLLQKWESKSDPKVKTGQECEVIAFADHELGPNEINLVARHVTTCVVTYLQNFKSREVSSELMSIVSALSKKTYASEQRLRSIYNDSSLYQLCEHLTESVICHLISSISDGIPGGRGSEKAWESQNSGCNKIISMDSQVFENRSISIGELALNISEIITKILFNSNIIEPDIAQQMFSSQKKYIYCPGVTATDFDHLFQDLLIGVIHVLSKVIGITHHLESNGSKPVSMLRSNSVSTCNKTNTVKRQISCRSWESFTHQSEHLIQKDKLNYLAYKLDSIVSSLKTRESKEVVNKVFNIVLDLFLPDERRGEPTDSCEKARKSLSSSSSNAGLTPKSVFLLNVVCEKLIRTLLEKCTHTVFLDRGPLSDGASAEECQLLKMLQNVEDEDFGDCKGAMGCEQLQGDYMSDLLENLAEMDPDVLSSDSTLTLISHSLVKSLMDNLCQNIQLPHNPPSASKHLKGRTQERQLGAIKAKRPGLAGFRQGKGSAGFASCDGHALAGSLNLSSAVGSKTQSPFDRKCSVRASPASPRRRRETAVHNKMHRGAGSTGVYSATFLEEIISELFFDLSASLWGKNEIITEAHLNEMNTLLVHNVVREFDRAQTAVLRDVEERLCFPPVQKALVRRVVDSVYPDVLQKYQLKVTCGVNLAHDNTSLAGQITNGILLEILDYQLPPGLRQKLSPDSSCPLDAEVILQKLQGSLAELASGARPPGGYSTRVPCSFLEEMVRRLLAQLTAPPGKAPSRGRREFTSSGFSEMSNRIINKVLSAISNHKIWFTICDNPQLCAGKNTQKMVDSVYRNLLQMSDSLGAIQNSLVSRSPVMVDRIASVIIQEIIQNHLQPFLGGEGVPRPSTPRDAVSNMVKRVLRDVTESHGPARPAPSGVFPHTLDELVSSVYQNVLQQHGLDPEGDKESGDGATFVGQVANLTVATTSDSLLPPPFSGDLSSPCSVPAAEGTLQDMVRDLSKAAMPSPGLPPSNTVLPFALSEDMIGALLSRIFSSASDFVPNTDALKDRSRVNFNEIASNIISDIRMKISQHDIQFSKDEETKFVYSEEDVQHLVDSVFENILQNAASQESVEQSIQGSNDALIDRIAGFIIKHICQQHLQPFVDRKALPSPADTQPDAEQRPWPPASVYSAAFLEDVIFGVLRKIFHRVLGIVQTKSARGSEDELLDKAGKLIHLIAEELSRAPVRILENAEEQGCLPPVERDVLQSIVDLVFSKVLQEYDMDILPHYDFLNDTETLAARVTKSILAHTFDFQIHPTLMGKLPFKSYATLNVDVLIKKVQRYITKSRFQRQASTLYTTLLSHSHLEKVVTQLVSQVGPLASGAACRGASKSELSDSVLKLIHEIMSIISKHAICIVKHGSDKESMISERDVQSMVGSIYADLSRSELYQSLTKDKQGMSRMPVSKIASFVIKEIFNHHLQSFLPNTGPSAAADDNGKQKAADAQQGKLALVVNSAAFLEEVIAELLCKLLYAFSHNVLAAEHPDMVKGTITDIVTMLVKSIALEFTMSEIVVSNYFDDNVCSSARYKEMVQNTASLIYEKILGEYKSLIQVYKVMQSDTTSFGRKIYHLLLEEIYDHQVQSLVSGELVSSSCSSLQTDNIIRNVLNVIMKASPASPCVTVLPRALLERIVYKLITSIFPPTHTESELQEEGVSPDDEFVAVASKLTDEIIKEITEHEIRLARAEENAESTQLEVIETLVDSICNNILEKSEFQAEVQRDADKKAGSFLSKVAGFIMREIMDHHLRPFLQGDGGSALTKPGKERTQSSLYSATFLEDVVVDLVRKFYSLLSITEDPKKKGVPETDLVGLAIKFANSLVGEFRKSEIKVLPNAEEVFAFPPVDKETVDKISNFVYDQFIGEYDADDSPKDTKGHVLIETIAALAQKAISAFKIQPLFSGGWSSAFFSFLNPDHITQRVQHLPQKTAAPSSTGLQGNQLAFSEQAYQHASPASDRTHALGTLELDRGTANRKKSLPSEETSVNKGERQDRKVTSLTRTVKCNLVNLLLGPAAGVATRKKENESKMSTSVKNYTKDVSTVTSPATSVKSKDSPKSNWKGAQKHNEPEKKSKSVATDDEKQRTEAPTQPPLATERKEATVGPNVDTDKRGIDKTRGNALGKEDEPCQSSLTPKVTNSATTTEDTVTPQLSAAHQTGSLPLVDVHRQYEDYEDVQNVTENIYDNILETCFAPESECSHGQHPPRDMAHVLQGARKDFAQSVSDKDFPVSVNKDLPAPEKEEEKDKERGRENEEKQEGRKEKVEAKIKSEPMKPDGAQYPPKSKPGIFPAKLLEDVIIEMVNKLILHASPEAQTAGRGQNVGEGQHQADLYDTAMKLIDSLLKELSKAQIKVFRPEKESPLSPPGGKGPFVPKGPPEQKEPTADGASPPTKEATGRKMSQMHKVMGKIPLNKMSFLDRIPAIDKTLVNRVVHSSVCTVLKEYRSQDSLCQNIKSNGGSLARRLTSAVINEVFQCRLNLELSDEVPASACLPLECKDVVRKVQKAVRTASKECQTSSPYTILLPHEFLQNVISALLHKVFSVVPKSQADPLEGGWLTELDFLQMKLLGTVMTEISKDEDVTIQYVESLHPNDDEVIQLVALSIYGNLLSQFGSQETIRNCVASGCRILSETIVELVLREVSGNQLQSYFSGELTPCQCAEVDSIIENILRDVLRSTDTPQPQPAPAHGLPYNILEEIAVQFLSKLLSVFPKVDRKRNKALETEMQNIMSKILTSLQEFISKSKIKLIPPAKALATVPLADNETIEKVVNSVYTRVLKHSGSPTSIFKDLKGKNNVLSDIIGFLMVKEISNSKFQPQGEQEVSSSELVLEAVKIMEKVIKIVDEFKSQDKSSSKKGSMLNATCLEEALALFLAKLVKLPHVSGKGAKSLSKPELNKMASQLTKSVTAEISKSNISLVAADSEGQVLNPQSVEMISQVIDSVYSNVLIQSGTYKDLYYDIKGTNRVFPQKVANLIIHGVSSVSLDTDTNCSKDPDADHIGDLDVNRIVQKAQEHAFKIDPDPKSEAPDPNTPGEEEQIKIVPHIGDKPIKIDPSILSQHLAVISVKTQPLEKLQVECFRNTGHSIAEVRRASIQGRSYSLPNTTNEEKIKKERRISLNRTGRLDMKPLQAVGRNSFQNLRKPDISKVELLKDVQNKQDLLIRLVVHDIEDESEGYRSEELMSDDYESVLREDIREESCEKLFEDIAMEADTESMEETWKPPQGPAGRDVKWPAAQLDQSTSSSIVAVTDSFWGKEPQCEREEQEPAEPIHHLIHRIMSTSSYNHEDLGSSASEAQDCAPDTPAKVSEEAPRPSISKQGSKMLARVTSALSKVFSRTSTGACKAAAPPPQAER